MAETTTTETQQSHFWGSMFKMNKCPSDKLNRLLKGIALAISKNLHPHDCNDLNPQQMAAFYRSVGGHYDPLFLDMPPASIAYIYKSLGCLHSLQPDLNQHNGHYESPSVPALKPEGFVTWETIQLLLGPDEHVPFLQNALRNFDVIDPEDGKPFPKDLPREAFPMQPDQKMVEWHEGVSERLRAEAQKEMDQRPPTQPGHDELRQRHRPTSSGSHDDIITSGDERVDAAHYFSNPWVYRTRDGRPQVVRTFSKTPGRVLQGGKAVALTARNTVKNVFDPHLWSGSHNDRRRRSATDVDSREREREESLPPAAIPIRHVHAPPSHIRHGSAFAGRYPREHDYADDRHAHFASPHRGGARDSPRTERPRRRDLSASSSERDESPGPRRPQRRQMPSPLYRRHRSQETPSPRGYFDDWERSPRAGSAHSSAFVSPSITPADRFSARGDGQRPGSGRSPMPPHVRRYSAEDEEMRRARYEKRRDAPGSASEHGSPIMSGTVPPSMNPGAFAQQPQPQSQPQSQSQQSSQSQSQAQPQSQFQPQRQPQPQPAYTTARGRAPIDPRAGGMTASPKPMPRYKHQSSLHPDEASRRRMSGNSTGSSSVSGDAEGEGYDSAGVRERPPQAQGTARGTPVAGVGVSGRRYPAEVPWAAGGGGGGVIRVVCLR